jgi:hypothetical protein
MAQHPHDECRDPACFGIHDRRAVAPIDQSVGKMPAKIQDMSTDQTFEQNSEPWTNAGNAGNRGKELEKNLWSQLSVSLKSALGRGLKLARNRSYLIAVIVYY